MSVALTEGVFSGRQDFMNAALFRKVAAVVASVPFLVPPLVLMFAIGYQEQLMDGGL